MQNRKVKNVAVLVSGGGTNLQSLIDAQLDGYFKSKICVVISNKEDAYGLERGKKAGIPTYVAKNDKEILKILKEYHIDLVVLAGYLKILGEEFLKEYENRIINIHPSLLPKYGGRGMYGLNVHKTVLASKDKLSGATVHFVTDEIDGGDIIIQEEIDISQCKYAEEIQREVLKIEHSILKKALKKLEEES